jgi:predicted ATPase
VPIKEIAQIGAVIGREFSYELIAAVAPHPKPDLDQALAQLTAPRAWRFSRARRPTPWCRTPPTTRCSGAGGRNCTARSPGSFEERLPHTEATEPELLAHHYTQAKLLPRAIPLWQKAGSLALGHMALTEASR